MSDDFTVAAGVLPAQAASVREVGEALACAAPPPLPDAGSSSAVVGAAIAGVLASVNGAGTELTTLGAALLEAAERYAGVDDAVAASLGSWSSP